MKELAEARRRLCLISGDDAAALADLIAADLHLYIGSVGGILTELDQPPDPSRLHDLLADCQIVRDLDVLFWPDSGADPGRILRLLALGGPVLAVWPGTIEGGRAWYSEPGRPDYYEFRLTDTVILRTRPTQFPDEVPFTVERIAS